MTREHLIEDIENVLRMARERSGAEQDERVRLAFEGLSRHVHAEHDVPERVESCLEESLRVLRAHDGELDEDRWDYACACLEAALDFAREKRPSAAAAPPGAGSSS
jgi:hypothetical protein